MEYALNTSENDGTAITPFKALYGVKPREPLMALTTLQLNDVIADEFNKHREVIRNDTFDTIELAQTEMAIRYDSHHRVPDLIGYVNTTVRLRGIYVVGSERIMFMAEYNETHIILKLRASKTISKTPKLNLPPYQRSLFEAVVKTPRYPGKFSTFVRKDIVSLPG